MRSFDGAVYDFEDAQLSSPHTKDGAGDTIEKRSFDMRSRCRLRRRRTRLRGR